MNLQHHVSSILTRRTLVGGTLASAGAALLAACGTHGASDAPPSPAGLSSAGGVSGSPRATALTSEPATSSAATVETSSPSASSAESPAESPNSSSTTLALAQPSKESDPASLRCLVNKMRPFAQLDWEPNDLVDFYGHQLRAEAAKAGQAMIKAAAADGVTLTVSSAYRSYAIQRQTYQHWVSVNGQQMADQLSARPGYSEHQTGLAVDFSSPEGCRLEECYEDTSAGRWLARNAPEHGFILRFPKGQQAVTGYLFEPWHYRYVGVKTAREYLDSKARTFEEFAGSGAAPDYAA